MDKKKSIYMAISALCILSSCATEEPAGRERPADDNRIYFRSALPSVSLSRAGDITSANFRECQVTCFNPDDTTLIDPSTGEMSPYFTDIRFSDDGTGRFFSQGEEECVWPDKDSRMHFFAYYPSADSMRQTTGSTFFNLVNASSKGSDAAAVLDYRMERFRVAGEIADQVDFLTAYSAGTLSADGDKGIQLDFKHQLARVELTAWGASDKYDFEIAGVRIGNPVVEGDFHFSVLASASGEAQPWQNTSGHQAPVEHIFSAGESVVLLSKTKESHSSEDKASSIMGKAGAAMMIPMASRIEAWEGKADPAAAAPGYSTDKMYFSVLLSVRNIDGEDVFPYPKGHEGMSVVYLAIDKDSGKINRRLYKIDDVYHTSPDKDADSVYTPTESETVRGFSWAALPVPAKWEAGKKYTYKLNYTDGIGWHDPADPEPGEPIIERSSIPFKVNVDEWLPADDYQSDINVPKR